MSRVGKKPIPIPEGATVTVQQGAVQVKGKLGTLSCAIPPAVTIEEQDKHIHVRIASQDRKSRAMQGLARSLVNNMLIGVSQGFERTLEINGIGYRAEVKGKSVVFHLGYSHPIDFPLPEGITATLDRNILKLSGIDKQAVGQTAASIRRLRPPEPYKGKGIKYAEEHIQRKAGKTGTK